MTFSFYRNISGQAARVPGPSPGTVLPCPPLAFGIRWRYLRTYFKTSFWVILNEVKDLNLLKIRDASRRSE
jgi:MoaA/NifB/PqqE/SkfB family radical SAM enzyme